MNIHRINRGLTVLFLATVTQIAIAIPIKFNFTFTGIDSPAMAEGYVVFEDTLLPNPADTAFTLPSPVVLDLSVTVTNASLGNGIFGIDAFTEIRWETNGGVLNFGEELIGQPTTDRPFGTTTGEVFDGPSFSVGGDFNLFSMEGPAPSAAISAGQRDPEGIWYFTLRTDGGEDMVLTSMRADGIPATAEKSQIAISNGYIKLDEIDGTPPDADCVNLFHFGRMVLSRGDDTLYVCTLANGWRSLTYDALPDPLP